jgi:hypothetical protein
MFASLFGSIAALFGSSFLILKQGWLTEHGLEPWGYVVAGAGGLAYVHLQTLAVVLTLALTVTRAAPPPSDPGERAQ